MERITIKKRKIVFGGQEIGLRKLTREVDPMEGKRREVVTIVGKDGTVDMKLASIETVERRIENDVNAKDGEEQYLLDQKFNEENHIA
jgi:hypothetical protein